MRSTMGLIDFILNLAGLLLWLSWRSQRFDPLVRRQPATLAGTLQRAGSRQIQGWQLGCGLVLLLVFRALLYWFIGAPADWTPKLDLGLIVPAFRSDTIRILFLFSLLSFLRVLLIFYFWLLVLAVLNRRVVEPDPTLRLVRLHLGGAAKWPWPVQVLAPFVATVALWCLLYPLLVRLGVIMRVGSVVALLEQGLLLAAGLFLTLKFLLPVILFLYLVASYVYLGSSPVWDFVTHTARNVLRPISWAPLRLARLDLAPVAAVALLFLLLHWLPRLLQRNFALWPQ